MKFKRKELVETLAAVKPALAKKGIVEQATHFIFSNDKLVTYNDYICISHPLKTDFECSVDADKLYRILSNINEDEIELSYDGKQMLIKSGNVRSGLAAMKEGEVNKYIVELGLGELKKWSPLPEDFLEGVFLCMFSAARDMAAGPLTAVCINQSQILSSDDLRISQYTLSKNIGDEFLVPIQSVIELVKFAVVKYILTKSWVHFKTNDNVIFSSRTQKDKYPDASAFFETEGTGVRFPKEMQSVVKSVSVLAEGDIDIDRKIQVSVSSGLITCRGEREVGWIERDLETKYKGRSVTFNINPLFLHQVLDKSTKMTVGENKALFESGKFKHVMVLPK
jgi:DNA polymerase III sliding clamp (beta) subunit (PCNA family)